MKLICEYCQKDLGVINPKKEGTTGSICESCYKRVCEHGSKRDKVRALMLMSVHELGYINPMWEMILLKTDYVHDYKLSSIEIDSFIHVVCEKNLTDAQLNRMLELHNDPILRSISEKFSTLFNDFHAMLLVRTKAEIRQ